MEELSLWIFPDKESKNVESELRERLLKSPRVKVFEERWKIALRFTSEKLQENFNILLSSKRKPVMERELEILEDLVMKDKSGLSSSLKNLDERNLTFPREELVPFLRSVDKSERDLKMQGKVVDADEMLRLKPRSLSKGASQLKASHHVTLLVTA